ncbi:MAG: DUF4338 domain-containing protein [Desulfobacterales bacterium]|nr:DUF4338 domain-containing protein [Desulfobacterales bacterium]
MLNQESPVTTCCGRPITSREFEEIRETVKMFGNLSRKELIHTICEHLNWRTPSGTNKWDACLKMMLSFEAQGHFTLPVKKSIAKPIPTRIRHTAQTAPGPPINSTLKALGPVTLTQPATTSEVRLFNEYIDRYHYLGYKKPIGYRIRYFIRSADTFLGCILFSGAARAITSRDQWIGWSANQRTAGLPWVVNNTRFLIFPWVRVPYLASHVLGKVAGLISGDWKNKWGYSPVLLETFVDPERYRGTCYLAANWQLLGRTTGKGLVRKNKIYTTQPKLVLAYPLSPDFRTRLCSNELQPKSAQTNTEPNDPSRFTPRASSPAEQGETP